LTDKIFDVIPDLSDAGIRGRYCGIYSTTPDHDFIIDEQKAATSPVAFPVMGSNTV
jgi:sarcosine oxidase, subunit beta